nr:hypothetical protein [Tanacetum cinerariifolium]
MSADSVVTYTSVHSEARSWSIPSEDPYEEAAQQLLEQAPHSPEYVPNPIELEDHVQVFILEHPKDLLPAEDEAPIEAYIPEGHHHCYLYLHLYHPLAAELRFPRLTRCLKKGYCLLLPDLGVRFRDTERRMMTALEMVNMRDRAAVRAEIEVLRRERLAYEQEIVMSADSAVTYTSVYSEARSWSIPSKDPYEEAAQQLLEQAPHSPDRKAEIPKADTPPQKRLLLTAPRLGCKVRESSAAARQPGPTMARSGIRGTSYSVKDSGASPRVAASDCR